MTSQDKKNSKIVIENRFNTVDEQDKEVTMEGGEFGVVLTDSVIVDAFQCLEATIGWLR